MPSVDYKKLEAKNGEGSDEIRHRVNKAREIQQKRYKDLEIYSNVELTPKLMEEYCTLDEASSELLNQSFERLNLSARAYSKILKVARTIADLDGRERIERIHLMEAIQYRSLDRI